VYQRTIVKIATCALVFGPVVVGVSGCSCGSQGQAAGTCSTGGSGGKGGGGVGGGAAGGVPAPAGFDASADCNLLLQFPPPVGGYFVAQAKVTCNDPMSTSLMVVSILWKPAGSPASDWVVVDSKRTAALPPTLVTAKAECLAGDWEATASLDVTDTAANAGHHDAEPASHSGMTTGTCAD
jgi:hypothetical protein